jgi:hypothetical protein
MHRQRQQHNQGQSCEVSETLGAMWVCQAIHLLVITMLQQSGDIHIPSAPMLLTYL